ncbi:MAG: hypothetical protein HY904_07230 [Deltaproteobacteria bacterium]|nr:hypothetical protein [Deltaproteobacteria bacterium]
MSRRLPVIPPGRPAPLTGAFVPRELPPRPGRLEQQLAALWTPRIRARLLQPRHWGDALHLRRHYDLQELHPNELMLDYRTGKLPDCEACVNVCCTGAHRVVLLRLVDVAALVDAGLEEFLTLDKPVFPAEETAANPALGDLVRSEAWRRMPVLRQDATRTCTLLREDNRCGAWPAWPLSCARFPYSLDILHMRVFFARSCGSVQQAPTREGRRREARLVDAVVDAYNQRTRDAVLLRVARPELEALGLARFIRWD